MLSRRCTLLGALLSAAVLALVQPASAQNTIDMRGKTALITGSTSGLGAEVAKRLGAMGATVIVHGRSAERGQEIVDEINAGPGNAVFYQADLGSLDEVESLAARVRENHEALHLLVNNAGIGGASQEARRESADGYELVFAVNYLSHFLLTRELLPLLEASAPARIVNVASIGQRAVDFADIMMTGGNYNQMGAYSQSKLAQIMFTISLAGLLDPAKVIVNSLHPATFMDTPMVTSTGREPMSSVEDGADAVMNLAVGTAVAGQSGLYFNQLQEARANAQAYDADARQRLWDLSLELIGNR
jgi:NAD(P)-dependent dehydrogenase (short-subunit alcohol dehydrogenase family)